MNTKTQLVWLWRVLPWLLVPVAWITGGLFHSYAHIAAINGDEVKADSRIAFSMLIWGLLFTPAVAVGTAEYLKLKRSPPPLPGDEKQKQ